MHVLTHLIAAATIAMWCALVPAAAVAQDPSVETSTQHPMTSADIRAAVEEELFFDPGVRADHVDVEIIDHVVTLTGTVDNLLARERAALVAETVKGVESVVNRIVVDPPMDRSGADLTADVTDALLSNPATDAYEITVSADDSGAVTLTGDVDSWAERELSGRIARGVRGVTDLNNDIVVRAPEERPDVEIQRDIDQLLRWSRLVDSALIRVEVSDGAVSLSGVAGSAAEKRQAQLQAWVTGVSRVDATNLSVARWARDDDLRPTGQVFRDDAAIGSAVERALLHDPRVNSLLVDVGVDSGVATLRGTVDTTAARRAALEDARNTVGVMAVRDRLRVRTTDRDGRTDAEVAQAVRRALERNVVVAEDEVVVTVLDGTAYLTGTVDNYFEKAIADDIAANVVGVADVNNSLAVRSQAWVGHDPFLNDPFVYGFEWYDYNPPRTWTSDEQIKQAIERQLWWSPFVDADDVSVSVDEGTATLTGSVESWSEFNAARENAYEGGAVWVDNDLTVTEP